MLLNMHYHNFCFCHKTSSVQQGKMAASKGAFHGEIFALQSKHTNFCHHSPILSGWCAGQCLLQKWRWSMWKKKQQQQQQQPQQQLCPHCWFHSFLAGSHKYFAEFASPLPDDMSTRKVRHGCGKATLECLALEKMLSGIIYLVGFQIYSAI